MNLQAKYYDHATDYSMIKDWFDQRKFPPPEPRFLPPTGAVVEVDGAPVACGFMFRTDAKAAVIGHLVTDPTAKGEVRNAALNYLIEALTEKAQDEGYLMVCCSTNVDRLMGRFEQLGFTKTDEGVANFGRILCQ